MSLFGNTNVDAKRELSAGPVNHLALKKALFNLQAVGGRPIYC